MTTTILLDTNAYLRLAKRIRPLLGFKFNPAKDYLLLVVPEIEDEVINRPRLTRLYPWFEDALLASERGAHMPKLTKADKQAIEQSHKFLLSHVARNATSYMKLERSPPGETDCYVLAVAMEKKWSVATDDENMHILGGEFAVPCFYGFDVMHKLHSAGMIDNNKVIEVYEALETNNDLPARWVGAKLKLFKKVFGKGRAQ